MIAILVKNGNTGISTKVQGRPGTEATPELYRGGWTLRNNLEMSHDQQFITHIVFNKTI